MIISKSNNINNQNNAGITALGSALHCCNFQAAKKILENPTIDLHLLDKHDRNILFSTMSSVFSNDGRDIIIELINRTNNNYINAVNSSGYSFLLSIFSYFVKNSKG